MAWMGLEFTKERGTGYFSGKRALVVALVNCDAGGVLMRLREAGGREAAKTRTKIV